MSRLKDLRENTIVPKCSTYVVLMKHFRDSSNGCSHLMEAMISTRLSKLIRFIVNNVMPNLESPLLPLWRAPKLLEVHLPQIGNSGAIMQYSL